MQKIFSIDFSSIPITMSINTVLNKDISVNEVSYINLDKDRFFSSLVKDEISADDKKEIIERLKSFIKKTNAASYNAIVVVPPIEQISMNVSLPFSVAPKHIDKIIANEVQDYIPLSTDDLHVQYQVLKKPKNTSSGLSYHVNLIPENIVKNILNILKEVEIDPFIITTPTSVLGVVTHLAKDYFSQDSVIMDIWGDFIHLLYIRQGGSQIHERSLPTQINGKKVPDEDLISQLKIAIRDFEKDSDSEITKIYYANNINDALVRKIGKEAEFIDIYQFINSHLDRHDMAYSVIASFLVQDSMPYILNNFRIGKYDCTVKPQEIIKIAKKFIPVIGVFLLLLILAFVALYYIRQFRLNGIYEGIKDVANEELQITSFDSKDIVNELERQNNQLQQDLQQISSSYKASPSMILEILSTDLSTINGLVLNSFEFRGNSVRLLGIVKDYKSFETLGKQLKQRKNFQNVETKQTPTRDGKLNFTVQFDVME